MKAFFEGIQFLFEKILFAPMNLLRSLELDNWWLANIITWIFIIICCAATWYWIKQLRVFKANNEDDQDTTAHSFLS
ncbi:uracil phosphoribosyltransferase [Flavobacterium cyanobacteriorum]|uniref:Uracil phosphoribosyltransferase n=1 Tax=Flavobacterium cyanobacteriorum TaxID=2022802 RepID=A0A255YVS4_9FLAO|nr:uracil phosphoribosyltransferase [Flavobacterium cyanobacteriorum]OYQ33302.1 uracil phosphoribosyltransferase [Flavobacterium cyanobacteriorum]